MRTKGKYLIAMMVPLLLVCLLLQIAGAATAISVNATQKGAKPAVKASPGLLNQNAPPQGSIAITSPQTGATWYTGTYHPIQWSCNGTRSNQVDVTLWQNDKRTAVIWSNVATGRTAYIVPLGTAGGSYELRVTSVNDPRIEAKMPIRIVPTSFTFTAPQDVLLTGSIYTINWSYVSNFQSVNLAIIDAAGKTVRSVPNTSIGTNGKGSLTWAVPAPPAGQSYSDYRFRISAVLPTNVTTNAKADTVLATSDPVRVRLPKIQIGSFLLKAGASQCSPGREYQITWSSDLNGKPVKVELVKANGGEVVQAIKASIPSQASNTIAWTAPSVAATLDRTILQLRVASLDMPAVQALGDTFTCEKPGISLTSPDPQQTLSLNQSYEIGWKFYGDPGPHIRVDLLSADSGGYNMKVFETPAQSTAVQGSTKRGEGKISWKLTNPGPRRLFYIQLQGIENSSVYDRRQYYISKTGATSGTVSGSTTSGTTGSSSTSATSSSSSSSGKTTQQQIKSNTSFKYNSSNSATFFGGSIVTLDADGHVVSGQLASDQSLYFGVNKKVTLQGMSLVTFSGGYVAKGQVALSGNQHLEYKSGKSVNLQAGSGISFGSGYVAAGQLALSGNQSFEYISGKSAQFQSGSGITFTNGYVTKGQLALSGNQTLEYRPGKPAKFQAGSGVVFKSGFMESGQLAQGSNQSLEYRSGKTATFTGSVPITFRTDGYVKSCQLSNATNLEYAPGQSKKWPALTWPIFNDNGYTTTH